MSFWLYVKVLPEAMNVRDPHTGLYFVYLQLLLRKVADWHNDFLTCRWCRALSKATCRGVTLNSRLPIRYNQSLGITLEYGPIQEALKTPQRPRLYPIWCWRNRSQFSVLLWVDRWECESYSGTSPLVKISVSVFSATSPKVPCISVISPHTSYRAALSQFSFQGYLYV